MADAPAYLLFMSRIGTDCQDKEQRNLHGVCSQHHIGKPYGKVSDVPEVEIDGGVQDACLQSRAASRENGVNVGSDVGGERHIEDDRQNAEQQRDRQGSQHVFKFRGEKQGKAGGGHDAEQTADRRKALELSDIHVRKIEGRIDHLHGSLCTLPTEEAV